MYYVFYMTTGDEEEACLDGLSNIDIYTDILNNNVEQSLDFHEIPPYPAVRNKLNLSKWITFPSHNSGWKFVYEQIKDLHDPAGLFVDDFIERTFSWSMAPLKYKVLSPEVSVPYESARRYKDGLCFSSPTGIVCNAGLPTDLTQEAFQALPLYYKKPTVYRCDWIGFWHNPPEARIYMARETVQAQYTHCPDYICKRLAFRESLKTCKGLFVFSHSMRNWVQNKLTSMGYRIPVHTLYHPIKFPEKLWSMKAYRSNPQPELLQIGTWLRNMDMIFNLESDHKTWICRDKEAIMRVANTLSPAHSNRLQTILKDFRANTYYPLFNRVKLINLDSDAYETIMANNIVVTEIIGSSCNNGIIECIASATPVLVNRLDSIEEYLGKDYPFYYSSYTELLAKGNNLALIQATHQYLLNLDTRRYIAGSYFREKFLQVLDIPYIDFVLTWVNSDDEQWQAAFQAEKKTDLPCDSASINRYRATFDELKYAMRGIQQSCGHFMRDLYLVIHDKQELPAWLKTSQVRVVRHSDIIPVGAVYNSLAIEACLDRIPGLSETFAYLNDDIWLLGNWDVSDFIVGQKMVFHTDGHEVCRGKGAIKASSSFEYAWRNNHHLLDRLFPDKTGDPRPVLAHGPYVLNRDLYARYAHLEEVKNTTASKFRNFTDIGVACGFQQYAALYTGKAISKHINTKTLNYKQLLRTQGNIGLNMRALTLQDDFLDLPSTADVIQVKKILNCLFPVPSRFEQGARMPG